MSDGRYCHSTLPSEPATEVDPPEIVAIRFEPHRIRETLVFPRTPDDLDVWSVVDPE